MVSAVGVVSFIKMNGVQHRIGSESASRQVSEAEGEAMARKYKTQFAESSATGDPRPLSQLLHTTFQVGSPFSVRQLST